MSVVLCCRRRLVARSQTVGKSSPGSCWIGWAAAGVRLGAMLHKCLLACRRLRQESKNEVLRTWGRVVAVGRRHVGVVARGTGSVAVALNLRGEARIILATVLRAARVGRGRRHVHGRVSAGCGALLLLQELLRLALLLGWPLCVVLGLVGVGILHLDVAVVVVEVRAAAGGLARRLQRNGAGARGRDGGCVWVLLKLRGRAGVPLRKLRGGRSVWSIPRLAAGIRRFGVGSPLLIHVAGRVRVERV